MLTPVLHSDLVVGNLYGIHCTIDVSYPSAPPTRSKTTAPYEQVAVGMFRKMIATENHRGTKLRHPYAEFYCGEEIEIFTTEYYYFMELEIEDE
jgi:hypothetical protein